MTQSQLLVKLPNIAEGTQLARRAARILCYLLVAGSALTMQHGNAAEPLTVVGWSQLTSEGNPPSGLTNVVAVDAGVVRTMTVHSDGTINGWAGWGSFTPPLYSDFVAVSIGAFNVLGLRSNGTVLAWGDDSFGETVVPAGLSDVVAIDSGYRQSLALKQDGTVVTWGQDGTNLPAGLNDIKAISANQVENYLHCLALRSNGTVVAWGRNEYGEGNVPDGLSNVVAIAAGGYHNLALKDDGTVVAWGGRDVDIITPPPRLSNVTAIAANEFHNLALKSDGTVVAWKSSLAGPYFTGADVPAGLTGVVTISAGRWHSVALTRPLAPLITLQPEDTDLLFHDTSSFWVMAAGSEPIHFTWLKDGVILGEETNSIDRFDNLSIFRLNGVGFETAGNYSAIVSNQLGSVTSRVARLTIDPWIEFLTQPASRTINAGENVTFSVTVVGSPPFSYQWRRNGVAISGATEPSLTLTNVQTEAGTYTVEVSTHGIAANSQPATLTVLGNVLPAIVTPPRSDRIFVGAKLLLRVTATGAQPLSYQWRKDGVDLPGQNAPTLDFASVQFSDAGAYTVVVSNAAGSSTSEPATLTVYVQEFSIGPPGIVVSLGGPIPPPGLTSVVAIAAGSYHSLALKSDGTVVSWGGGILPPMADPTTYNPVPAGLSNVVAIAAGNDHSLALRSDGTVAAWGGPGVPGDLYGVVAIAAGTRHGLALKGDGTVVAWGSVPPVPNALENVVAVAAGGETSLALKNNGTVAAWGVGVNPNVFGQANDIVRIASGRRHVMALRANGSVVDYFHLGASDPTNSASAGISGVVEIAAGDSHSLALKSNGTVAAWNGSSAPDDLQGVVAISAGKGYSLVLVSASGPAPRPALTAAKAEGNLLLSSPVAVSGYILETADDLTMPFQPFNLGGGVMTFDEARQAVLSLPASGAKKFFRFRKVE